MEYSKDSHTEEKPCPLIQLIPVCQLGLFIYISLFYYYLYSSAYV